MKSVTFTPNSLEIFCAAKNTSQNPSALEDVQQRHTLPDYSHDRLKVYTEVLNIFQGSAVGIIRMKNMAAIQTIQSGSTTKVECILTEGIATAYLLTQSIVK